MVFNQTLQGLFTVKNFLNSSTFANQTSSDQGYIKEDINRVISENTDIKYALKEVVEFYTTDPVARVSNAREKAVALVVERNPSIALKCIEIIDNDNRIDNT